MSAGCVCRSAAVLVAVALSPFAIAFAAPENAPPTLQSEIIQLFPVAFPMTEVEEVSFSGKVSDLVLGPNLADVHYVARAERFTLRSGISYSVSESRTVLYKNVLPTPKLFFGMRRPVVSPDGGHVACAVTYVIENQQYGGLLLDGRFASEKWTAVGNPVWHPSAPNVAHTVSASENQRSRAYVGIDGVIASAAFDFILDRVTFVPGSTTVAFGARAGASWAIYRGTEKVSRDFAGVTAPVFGADGRPVYGAQTDWIWAVYSGGGDKLSPYFDEIGTLILSTDGKHLAYKARQGKSWCIWVDHKKASPCFDSLQDPLFVPGTERVIYAAPASGGVVLMSGSEKLSRAFRAIGQIRVSSDGRYVAYDATGRAGRGHFIMVNAQKATVEFSGPLDFLFTDGGQLVFAAYDDMERKIVHARVGLQGVNAMPPPLGPK